MAAWQAEAASYMVIGRMFFPVYIGALAGMLHFRRHISSKPVFWARAWFWLAFGGLFIALIGDIGAFWSSSSNFAVEPLTRSQAAFFPLDFLGAALAQVGLLYYGLGLVWSNVVPARFGWLLAAAALLGIPLSFLNIPAGTIFASTAFWVAASIWHWSDKPVPASRPLDPSQTEEVSLERA